MYLTLKPWQLYLVIIAGWVHWQQQFVIEYLITENKILREVHGPKRILLTDDQRRRLAVKGKILGRKLLAEVGTVFTPDTILRWHRQLVAQKWDYTAQRKQQPGRPRVRQEIVDLVVRMAKENPSWGYDRIQGALANVGYPISDTTVGNILKAHGIEPAPDRQRTGSWSTFLKAHRDVLASVDFTTVEVWTKGGLLTFYLLFVMELKTRKVHLAGITTSPHERWMKQIAKNLTDFDGFLLGKEYLLMDRDGKFCPAFRQILIDEGVEPLLLPPRSPNLNAHLERFMRSIKTECLSRMIFFGEDSLRRANTAYLDHYHAERNHQGLENRIITPNQEVGSGEGTIECREQLGGMLKYYHRHAA
jgi:putative transposase